MGSFGFNALLGRDWPATSADLQEVEMVCHGVGLSPLLARMPGGINQMVGETGWQLSHGEKSRRYMARALLQGADCIVLDESFGAWDPRTFEHVFRFVLERVKTLIVIAPSINGRTIRNTIRNDRDRAP